MEWMIWLAIINTLMLMSAMIARKRGGISIFGKQDLRDGLV